MRDSPFTLAWHMAAAQELMRVTRGELRLYPTTTRWLKPCRHPYALAVAEHFAARAFRYGTNQARLRVATWPMTR